jgi:hypothetical protein
MLTKADDYPVHQTSHPIAHTGSDRNFYDRYFFNGYSKRGESFFALALGVYPNLDVMDAAFAVIRNGIEHCVLGSRRLGMERMDTRVGPIRVEVIEPLQSLRLVIDPNEHGLAADLRFDARARAIEEPHFLLRVGPRVVMDLTRLTQNGAWTGWVEIDGDRTEVEPEHWRGTRDRSWGIRPVGEQPPAGAVSPPLQFYWLWAPVNFDDGVLLFSVNEYADGSAWHENALWADLGDAEPLVYAASRQRLELRPGTRHAKRAEVLLQPREGPEQRLELEPLYHFYMKGVGYTHPDWGHGRFKGDLAVGGERFEIASVDETQLDFQHVQAICRARLGVREGMGVLEQLIIGPHGPSGFKDLLDMAP